MKFRNFALAAIILILSNSANAALIDNGYYTTDDANGLEWLDLNLTAGLSINAVLAGSGGYTDDGWGFANFTQVASLYSSAGAAPSLNGAMLADPEVIFAAQNLNNLLGTLSPSVTFGSDPTIFMGSSAFAMSDDGSFASQFIYQVAEDGSQARLWDGSGSFQFTPDEWNGINPNLSHYLVRSTLTPVPLPAAAWLFCSGLIGLAGFSRCRQV